MKLMLDIGNTRMKVAVPGTDGPRVIYQGNASVHDLLAVTSGLDIDGGLWCSTRGADAALEALLSEMGVERLTHETPVPLKNCYGSPQSLGMDRMAAAVGAWSMAPAGGCPLLVVDAGTAITFDLVSAYGEFLGGNIAPGIGLRLRSLYEHTGMLPLVEPDGELPAVGHDTQTAIRCGVIQGVNRELDGYVADLRRTYPDLLIFLTGGDSLYFDIKGKSGIFAVNNLLFRGLEHIIGYNEK